MCIRDSVNTPRTDTGSTALHAAANKGHNEVVKLLLDKCADVDASRTTDDVTPFY